MKYKNTEKFKAALSRAAAFAVAMSAFAGSALGQATEVQLELERSTNLVDWESVILTGDEVSASGKILLPYVGDTGFFRLKIEISEPPPPPPPPDADGYVLIPGGTMVMNSEPTTVETFKINQFEVTWGEWLEVRNRLGDFGYWDLDEIGAGCTENHPVRNVSWYDVVKWCNLKSEVEGLQPVYTVDGAVYRTGEYGATGSSVIGWDTSANGYRLPSAVEWEFAGRGGNSSQDYAYAGSQDLDAVGWWTQNSAGAACPLLTGDKGIWPVGQKLPNEMGLYDMSGNMMEWSWDLTVTGVAGNNDTDRRVHGGMWRSSGAFYCEVARVQFYEPTLRFNGYGFRLALNPPPAE